MRAFDPTSRPAVVDGHQLCETLNGFPTLSGSGVSSRVVDLATGRTVLATPTRGGESGDAVDWTVPAVAGSVEAVAISVGGWTASGSSAGNVRVRSPQPT